VNRPAPVLTEDNHGFWDAAAEHRLVIQRCTSCGRLSHPPRPLCPNCHSLDQELVEAAGTGTLYSYALLHHPQHPAFDYPVVAALVELTEGTRLLTNLVRCPPDQIRIGMAVRVAFEPAEGDTAVPVFEPADDPAPADHPAPADDREPTP
jgi:uncharacterized OB-fold protein